MLESTAQGRLTELQKTVSVMEARRNMAVQREAQLRPVLGAARGRLALQPDIQKLLDTTQNRLHARTVGTFEDLLTALVRDVLQGDQQIRMTLDTSRGTPALSVGVERQDQVEDIWDGNGGALTNVVCAGLRMIALTRSGLRPFLLLDEAESWCAPEVIPQFVSIFADLSTTTQVQTLFISHHNQLLFDPRTALLRLVPQGDETRVISERTRNWAEETAGIRSIRLINVRRFKDAELALYPGVNALIGPNSAGKSTIASALRAVAYGDCTDGLIRHGEKQAQVILTVENGQRIEWSRQAKGSPKMRWKLLAADGHILRESTSAKGLPDWLETVLGFKRPENLDIQLLHQKTPVFLLNEPAQRQAAVLSVGQESSHLPDLMARYRKKVQEDQALLRQGEAELTNLLLVQEALQDLPELVRETDRIQDKGRAISALEQKIKAVDGLHQQWASLTTLQRNWLAELSALGTLPEKPVLRETAALTRMTELWPRLDRWLHFSVPDDVPAPVLRPTRALVRLVTEWEQQDQAGRAVIRIPDVAQPRLHELQGLLKFGKEWVAAEKLSAEVNHALERTEIACREANQAWLDQMNTVSACPLCGQTLEGHRHAKS